MIIPLLFFLIMVGDMMGITRDQTEGKYVYYAEQPAADGSYGIACIPKTLGGSLCRGLEVATEGRAVAVLYAPAWSGYGTVRNHVARHEVEHLLRALGQAPGDTYDEEDVERVTCKYVWTITFCD